MKKSIIPKLGNFAIGIWVWWSINNIIKLTIYPYIVVKFHNQFLLEILFIFLASTMVRLLMILTYDYLKIDWFLLEEMKQKKGKIKKPNRITRKIEKMKNGWNKFFILGLTIFDPFVSVIYVRPDHFKWNGFAGTKTKIVFLMSNLVAAITVYLGINFLLYLFFKAGS